MIRISNIRLLVIITVNFMLLPVINAETGSAYQNSKKVNTAKSTEEYSDLKVTELHYHPADIIIGIDTISGKKLEFIELKNTGETSLDLSGFKLDSAVRYTFPDGAVLSPDNFFVVASNPSWFYEFYKQIPTGNFKGNFSNSSEQVLLTNALGEEIINFIYYDDSPWPTRADGDGYSMVSSIYDPASDPNDPYYWRASLRLNGSPFKDDDGISGIDPVSVEKKGLVNIYPNPSSDYIYINLLSGEYYQLLDIKLFTADGTLVYQTVAENNTMMDLDKTGLTSGIYFIRIEASGITETLKFIYMSD